MEKTVPTSIDDYIAGCPAEVQPLLHSLRRSIAEAASQTTEKISRGMATFDYHGNLVYFSAQKEYIDFYPTPSALKAFAGELQGHICTAKTVRFSYDQPLPLELVARMVTFSMQKQEGLLTEKQRYQIPDSTAVFPNEYKTTCFIKNVVTAPNITVGDYTYYDDPVDPTAFEQNNVLFNWPEFGDKLAIGKFCAIASGTRFIMGPANHRTSSISTYPFAVFGGTWAARIPAHLEQLPFKGDIVVGNDVWIGRESTIMPGVKIGDGVIVAAYSVVAKNVEPYTVVGGNPAKPIKKRFDDELVSLLLELKWWDFPPDRLEEFLPVLCDSDLQSVRQTIKTMLQK